MNTTEEIAYGKQTSPLGDGGLAYGTQTSPLGAGGSAYGTQTSPLASVHGDLAYVANISPLGDGDLTDCTQTSPLGAGGLDFFSAATRLKGIVTRTPLMLNHNLSRQYQCNVYLKREDLQVVRSYKLRGAYNMMSSLPIEQLQRGVVCASAGNHAQGFAYSCRKLKAKGVVFMPVITPNQKITQTKMFGEEWIEVKLVGDTFDDCAIAAKKYTEENALTFIPPFDDLKIVEGQGTMGIEILEDEPVVDFLFLPVVYPNSILRSILRRSFFYEAFP